ncbi:hypothetical protein HI914_01580 [Erysiphe necator]|nr:hypothetical protein HI914_01580 [Erysiphe necator]
MATIGHPLSDLSNLITPIRVETQSQAKISELFSIDTKKDLARLYANTVGWDPTPDLNWGLAFGLFKLAVILQGIASRYALRQASNAKAKEMAKCRHHAAQLAWNQVQINIENSRKKPKL